MSMFILSFFFFLKEYFCVSLGSDRYIWIFLNKILLVLRDYYKRIRNSVVEGTWLNDEGVEPWRELFP